MKRLSLIVLSFLIAGCATSTPREGAFREWQEEVRLNDGRVITVKQKWRCDRIGKDNTGKEYCATMRESWLSFRLPEFSNQDIEWNEQLRPMVLNVQKGQLYLVGILAIGAHQELWGNPSHPYIGFRWEVSQWRQVSFEEIPEAIYSTNMATEFPPSQSPGLFKLEAKVKSNSRNSLPKPYKRIDPNFRIDPV